MTQTASLLLGKVAIQVELPAARCEVLPGVCWGLVEAFPTPAYWAYQVIARRLDEGPRSHRLGQTLAEELGACLLGGHGIPASIGLAAFERCRERGLFRPDATEFDFLQALLTPLTVGGRMVRYRFAAQKARFLARAMKVVVDGVPSLESGRLLRDWLLRLEGVGPKTASWVARNWLDADDVAILDIHVLRAGVLSGFLDRSMNVARHYLELEAQFLRFATALGVRASELDAVIWRDMMSSPRTVSRLLTQTAARPLAKARASGRASARTTADVRHAGAVQAGSLSQRSRMPVTG